MPREKKIQLRRGTAAQWTSANPILADGEQGYEKNTKRFKIGDGVTAWNSLPYATEKALEGADIEVAAIGLTDGTGTAPKPGHLTLNANGHVVVGIGSGPEGDSNAEDLPYLVDSRESLNFATCIYGATMNNVNYTRKLAEIPLPSSALAHNKLLHVFGSTFAQWGAGNKPDAGAYLVICKEGQDPQTSGMTFTFAEGATTEERSFSLGMYFNVVAGVWTLGAMNAVPSAIIRKNAAGTITHLAGWAFATDWSSSDVITGAVGEPVKLELYLFTGDTSNVVSANLFASGQLSVVHQ